MLKAVRATIAVATLFPLAVFAGDYRIASVKELTNDGGRLSWSAAKNLIAFDRANSSGFYDVWTMNPDGSAQTCLTCGKSGITTLNKGNPDWHPSGNFLAIQVQISGITYGPSGNNDARPGVGANNDIWIMDAAGNNYWQITHVTPHEGGVLHAHFSHDGTKLLWAERTSVDPAPNGTWVLRVGTFTVSGGVPSVTNIQTLTPGPVQPAFYESHGFSRDDSTIFFSGTPNGQVQSGLDIYSYNLSSGVLTNLTNTPNQWDEHARPMANADKLIWMTSSQTYNTTGSLQTEYWMMDLDGNNKNKLSWFNDPRSQPQTQPGGWYLGPVVCGDSDWSADGTQLAAYIITGSTLGSPGTIWLFTFEPSTTTTSNASALRPPVASQAIMTTYGSNLASSSGPATSLPLPLNLNGASITVTDAQGVERPAPLFFASALQLNWLLPAGTAPGPAVVTMTSPLGTSRGTFDVEKVAPGIYTANSSGSGPMAGYATTYLGGSAAQPEQVTASCPAGAASCVAKPISVGSVGNPTYLTLFATGTTAHTQLTASVVSASGLTTPLQVQYAGPQGVFTGLDQINVALPSSLAGAGVLSLYITADGVASNVVQVEIQ